MLVAGCGESSVTLADLEAAAASIEVDLIEVPNVKTDAAATVLDLEKTNLKLGFIKLTDCAPLVIAKEKSYFDDEGLNVEIEAPQALRAGRFTRSEARNLNAVAFGKTTISRFDCDRWLPPLRLTTNSFLRRAMQPKRVAEVAKSHRAY